MKIRTFLGYFRAALAVPIVILSLTAYNQLGRALVNFTGIKIAPQFTGGEIVKTIEHKTYNTHIYESVSQGFIKNIQVYFEPVSELPETIREELFLPDVSSEKFFVILNTANGRVKYENKPGAVKDTLTSIFKNGWAVRIKIEKP